MLQFVYHAGYMHEARELVPPSQNEPWYLVLCGNYGRACHRPELARQGLPQYGDSLASVCHAGWEHVFLVPGPREFAGSEYETVLSELGDLAATLDGKLTVLEDESVAHLDKTTGITLWVTGTTLWTHVEDTGRAQVPRIFARVPPALDMGSDSAASSDGQVPQGSVFLLEGIDDAGNTAPVTVEPIECRPIDVEWWNQRHDAAKAALADGIARQPAGSIGVVITHHQPTSLLDKHAGTRARKTGSYSDDVRISPHVGRTRLWFHAHAERDGQRRHLNNMPASHRFVTLDASQRRRLLTFCGTADIGQREALRRAGRLNQVVVRARRDSLEACRELDSACTAQVFAIR